MLDYAEHRAQVDAMRDKIVANMAALRQRREANVNDSALCADCDHQIAELRNLLTLCESAVEDFGEIRRDAAVLRQFAERARGGERDSILTKFEQLESVYDQLVAETEQLKRQRAEHAHDVLVVRQCDEAILACETRIELLWLELDEAMLELEAGAE